MASTRRKAAAVAIAIVGVAGLSLAAAAQLNITTDTLGAGTQAIAACDTDGINVDYTVVGDKVTEILLSGIADACAGDSYSIQLQQGTTTPRAVLGTAVTGNLTLAGTTANAKTATIPFAAANQQTADLVTGIAIVIN